MFDALKALASANPHGFTVRLLDLTLVTSGYVCAHDETQNSFDDDGLRRVIEHAETADGLVGMWYDLESDRTYWDSVRVFESREEAVVYAKAGNQLAIFHLDTGEEIRL